MTYLDEVFDINLFHAMADQGYVRVQNHLTDRLSIVNYSEKAVFDKVWNPVTLQCRGLIYNHDTMSVVARPFRKFFNHQESTAPVINLAAPVTVTDKQDGSLGILYPTWDGRWAVATRGSFDSEQARHATELYRDRYEGRWAPLPGITYLFEIIYPENRIVVDYGRLDDLVLLGAVDIATGKSIGPDVIQGGSNKPVRIWPGPVTQTFDFRTYGDALAAAPRPGKEGFVVHDVVSDERVKIKQEDYVILHRIVTGLTSRRVHEAMLAGIDLDEFIAPLPDEFHDWVRTIERDINGAVAYAEQVIDREWHQIVGTCEEQSAEGDWPISVSMGLGDGSVLTRDQRKMFASIASRYTYPWAHFARLDGKDYKTRLLKDAEPEIETPQGRTFTEATA